MINQLARITELRNDLADEVQVIRATGYSGEHHNIYYDYIYKWSKLLNVCRQLGFMPDSKQFVDIGGGLSPIQFILARYGVVHNLDIQFDGTWFPTKDKFYLGATDDFIRQGKENLHNIRFITGGIESISTIPSGLIDAVIDICSLHTFINRYDPDSDRDMPSYVMGEIARVLRPGGYFISIGDIANPHLGGHDDEFWYPYDMLAMLSVDKRLKLLEPFDYEWEDELKTPAGDLAVRRNVDYNDLSLMNMKYDPKAIDHGNIMALSIHIWTATYVFQRGAA